MGFKSKDDTESVELHEVTIPNLTVKDLLGTIPAHCFKRSAFRSSLYLIWDCIAIAAIYKTTTFLDAFITPDTLNLPHPILYPVARFSLWSLYGFWAGLFSTGVWVVGHECGHQAFSESKFINNTVGWVLHSAFSVPYHSWRISHARHHAVTGHMTLDEVFVPPTRSDLGLPPLDPAQENILGSSVTEQVKRELMEAVGDSPLSNIYGVAVALLGGWLSYLMQNTAGQKRYPPGTNHFNPSALLFAPHQYWAIVISDIGVFFWLAAVLGSIYNFGFLTVFRVYLVPYLWVNHWVVLITFLHHTDPILPHYRAPEYTFSRGALATLNRSLMGDCGAFMGFMGALATHGVSETHVLHHVCSKIPHYNAWEASEALRQRLRKEGINPDGKPVGWIQAYRSYRDCKFVEDEGNIIFYKNSKGLATCKPKVTVSKVKDDSASDSGVELEVEKAKKQ